MSTWEEAENSLAGPTVSPETKTVLLEFLTKDDDAYDGTRLRIGADLKPPGEGCDRQSVYRLKGVPKDAAELGTQLRFHGGRMFERMFVDAFEHAGHEIETQVVVWPMRPSFWAWSPGHADILFTQRKHLIEIKAPRARLFEMARKDPRKLVKPAYAWQLAFYFHELRRQGRALTASWLFLDREGSHAPVEVPLTDDLLIPLDKIIAREEEQSHLLSYVGEGRDDLPPRLAPSIEVRLWKGGRATKANPTPLRRVEATEVRPWQCSYCAWAGTCQPGPEERPVTLEPADHQAALAQAEASWAKGDKRTPQVVRLGGGSEWLDDEAGSDMALAEKTQERSLTKPRGDGPASGSRMESGTSNSNQDGCGNAPTEGLATPPSSSTTLTETRQTTHCQTSNSLPGPSTINNTLKSNGEPASGSGMDGASVSVLRVEHGGVTPSPSRQAKMSTTEGAERVGSAQGMPLLHGRGSTKSTSESDVELDGQQVDDVRFGHDAEREAQDEVSTTSADEEPAESAPVPPAVSVADAPMPVEGAAPQGAGVDDTRERILNAIVNMGAQSITLPDSFTPDTTGRLPAVSPAVEIQAALPGGGAAPVGSGADEGAASTAGVSSTQDASAVVIHGPDGVAGPVGLQDAPGPVGSAPCNCGVSMGVRTDHESQCAGAYLHGRVPVNTLGQCTKCELVPAVSVRGRRRLCAACAAPKKRGHRHDYSKLGNVCRCGLANPKAMTVTSETVGVPVTTPFLRDAAASVALDRDQTHYMGDECSPPHPDPVTIPTAPAPSPDLSPEIPPIETAPGSVAEPVDDEGESLVYESTGDGLKAISDAAGDWVEDEGAW